jgi:hypothetical protein
MFALTGNLHLFGSCFLTGLTAGFVATLHQAPAGSMRTLVFLICRHRFFLLCYVYFANRSEYLLFRRRPTGKRVFDRPESPLLLRV